MADPCRSQKYEALPAKCSEFEDEYADDKMTIVMNTGLNGPGSRLTLTVEQSDSIGHLKRQARTEMQKAVRASCSECTVPSVAEMAVTFSGQLLAGGIDSRSLGECQVYKGASLAVARKSHCVSFLSTTTIEPSSKRKQNVDISAIRFVNESLALKASNVSTLQRRHIIHNRSHVQQAREGQRLDASGQQENARRKKGFSKVGVIFGRTDGNVHIWCKPQAMRSLVRICSSSVSCLHSLFILGYGD
jgi:hypothetical protein